MERKVYRVLDVNLNRAREGLRVCEEITRFIFTAPTFTKRFKAIRLKITELEKHLNKSKLFTARNSLQDIGRSSKFDIGKRRDFKDLFFANIRRSQESLRVLEEFSKLVNNTLSEKFKKLRFQLYTLEKKTYEAFRSLCNIRYNNRQK